MNKRLISLIAALLAVIMLIPSVALAADAAPTLKINKDSYTAELKGNLEKPVDLTEEIVVTPTGLPKGSTATLSWHSSKPGVVSAGGNSEIVTPPEGDPSATTFAGPYLYPWSVCEGDKAVVIKADLKVTDKDGLTTVTQNAISFKASFTLVKEGKIAFKEGTKTTFTNDDKFHSFSEDIELDTKDGTSTYGIEDLTWKVENTDTAVVDKGIYVDDRGNVEFLKPGTFKLTATARGTGESATITLTYAKDEDPFYQPSEEVGISFLAFKAETVTSRDIDNDLNLWEYLKALVEGDWTYLPWEGYYGNLNDNLIWSSSDTTVATVDYGWVHPVKLGKPVTITVKSKKDEKITASVTVIFLDEEEEEEDIIPYTTWEFVSDKPTVQLYHGLSAWDYLKHSPTNANDDCVFISDDPWVASVDKSGWVDTHHTGTATITAKTVYGKQSSTLTITVVEDPAWTVTPIKKIAFLIPEVTVYADTWLDSVDLWDNLDVEWGDGDVIIWTTTDSKIADIEYDYDEEEDEWYPSRIAGYKAGEATITAKSKYGDQESSIKVIVKEAEELPTQYTTFKFGIPSLSVYEYEGINLWDYLAFEPMDEGNMEQILWTSSNPDVVYVDQWGGTRIQGVGETTITAKTALSNQTATLKVTVKKDVRIPITSITASTPSITLYVGDEACLGDFVTVAPARHDGDYLIWTSSDETVAYVSNYEGDWLFEDKRLDELTEEEKELEFDDNFSWHQWVGEDENGNEVTYVSVWINGDESWVYPYKEGTVTITARSYLNPSISKSIDVTVKSLAEKTFDSISFTAESYTVKKSAYTFDSKLYIVLDPIIEDVDYADLVWTSSDETIATVNENGVVFINQDISDETATVTITARAYANAKATKSYKLVITNDDQYYKSLTFVDSKDYTASEISGTFDARKYLVEDPLPTKQYTCFVDEIIWSSSNLDIAYVTPDGIVHFVKDGKVKITARSKYNEKVTDSFTLTISKSENPITAITMTQDTLELSTDASGDIITSYLKDYLVIKPIDYTEDWLVWTSDNENVAYVNDDGELILVKPGTAKLTVRSGKNGVTASFTLKVTEEALTSIKFIKEVPTELTRRQMDIDLSQYLVTEPWYYAYMPSLLEWTSDSPQYAGVDESGTAYYRQPGKTVTISVCDKERKVAPATIKLTTTDVWVTDITFANGDLEMKVGDFLSLDNVNVLLTPADADYSYIEWSTSDPDIVDLEFDDYSFFPRLIAKGVGTAKITAHVENAYNQVSKSFKVTVSEHTVSSVKFAKSKYTKKISRDSSSSDNYVALYFTVKPYDMSVEEVKNVLDIQSSDRSIVDVLNVPIEYDASKNMYFVVAKCVKPGTAKVTITNTKDDKVLAKTKVIVKGIAVKKVKMPKKTMKLFFYDQGETRRLLQNYYQIKPVITPSNAWYNVTWETTNPGVAFVEYDLEKDEIWVVATGAGSAIITMNVDDGTAVRQAKMKVIVNAKTVDLKMSKKKATITMIKGKDNTLQLEAINKVTDEPMDVRWTSSNKKVATVDKNGLVTAKKAGTAVITATTKDGNETSVTCNLTVEKKEVTSLKAKSSIELKKKDTKQLKIKVKPTDAYDTSLSFKSSDENVVTVDSKGLVTAVGVGEATIKVTTKDGTKLSIEIAVTVTKK